MPPRFKEIALFEKGETVVVKIPFTGYPKPDAWWTHKGEEMENTEKYHIDVQERHAVLTIRLVHCIKHKIYPEAKRIKLQGLKTEYKVKSVTIATIIHTQFL